jgi:dephospho-CoA kinase
MKWIGLTGGIATGKSAAKEILEHLGIPVIDADQIAHFISQPGQQGFNEIVKSFGPQILTDEGLLDRAKLGEVVFKSDEKKLLLESLLHPIIQTEVLKQKSHFEKSGFPICFYDVPLLFEKKLQDQFMCTVLIWCDYETQLQRLITRNSLSTEQALDRIKSQLPLYEKLPLATYCIDNSTTLESLQKQIESLLAKLQN